MCIRDRRWGEQVKQDLFDNEALHDYLFRLWADFVSGVEDDLDDPESMLYRQMSELLSGLAQEMERDEEMQVWVNGWLVESAVSVVAGNRHSIASLISDTVRRWDAKDTSHRVELAIGRDLQFIRINGTLVGGLVGVAIHALTNYL